MKHRWLYLMAIILITIILRLANLGYSDYQGDEIKALFLPTPEDTLQSFLLDQRKGPIQFLITFLIKPFSNNYTNEFVTRLPFAIAGMLAIVVFFKLVELKASSKIAFYASFFLATNGFFVAFSRLVQYQSFVILFMLLALYMFTLAVQYPTWKYKGLYFGFTFWALSILAHYDGVFITPFVIYLTLSWVNKYNLKEVFKTNKIKSLVHIILPVLVFICLLSLFYIPFVFSISDKTADYWRNRISGGEGKLSSSHYLFSVYQPIYVVHIYMLLAILGGLFISGAVFLKKASYKLNPKWANLLNLFKTDNDIGFFIAVTAWFLITFIFMEVLINLPGTHIYTYLVPITILIAYGIIFIERVTLLIFRKSALPISLIGVTGVFIFIALQTYAVFVDNSQEYPWEEEKFFIWTFNKPTPIFHLSMFGFPYHRNWEDIKQYVETNLCPDVEICKRHIPSEIIYSTNERKSIARHYLPYTRDSKKAGFYIHIINPQSFTNEITNSRIKYWVEQNPPIAIFKDCAAWNWKMLHSEVTKPPLGINCRNENKEIARIYYMPPEILDEVDSMDTDSLQEETENSMSED